MAVILKKLKGKTVYKGDPEPEWQHLLTLLKLLLILFLIFSSFHWIVKKRVQHLPADGLSVAIQTTTETKAQAQRMYTVKEGDTLWKIAIQFYPQDNPVTKIKEIMKVNHMKTDSIKAGQPLKLP
ncbi:LysM peptidoglycan-binding domain-containing protein [Ammoniphilus sp. YIM 78166]|uniref:LysM peptidoglycan-binding domain-containing protein n=1 Tax=Ammoniphilus sp. YIM 78166 TaxID=1644106 RepID=UPI001430AEF8|nr:LysM peptidoglycan-binding domain-containing protein [Ammoniphilus sp. YIM 78166]